MHLSRAGAPDMTVTHFHLGRAGNRVADRRVQSITWPMPPAAPRTAVLKPRAWPAEAATLRCVTRNRLKRLACDPGTRRHKNKTDRDGCDADRASQNSAHIHRGRHLLCRLPRFQACSATRSPWSGEPQKPQRRAFWWNRGSHGICISFCRMIRARCVGVGPIASAQFWGESCRQRGLAPSAGGEWALSRGRLTWSSSVQPRPVTSSL